ncbi:MAG: YqaJ viral recombinase family protein [Ruminococcus sp.]|nr:YqaJ viral recombinase family protein [Ruminococcus sp.]
MFIDAENREEWLKIRRRGIGGSDAGTAVGMNKYKSNVQLWREKTGLEIPADISDKPAVSFGKQAEKYLREIYKLEHPENTVKYSEFGMYFSDRLPFMFATLDGEITTPDGLRGVLEIKTTTIQNSLQWDEWDNRIPDSYYIQVLHQLSCTGFDFAVVIAYIRYHTKDGEFRTQTKYYPPIDRQDKLTDIEWLEEKEKTFWQYVVENRTPPLILSEI